VKAPLPMLGLSNGARAGLTGAIGGIAREVARDGVTINNLLPGHFATDRRELFQGPGDSAGRIRRGRAGRGRRGQSHRPGRAA